MRQLTRSIAAIGVAVGILFAASSAAAQEQGGGVINLEETVIEGRIQKPEAFYILQHANLSYEALEPKRSFIPDLLESVEREPF